MTKRKRPDLWVSGVYRIYNTVNDKFYIGSSYDVHIRWGNHITALLKNIAASSKLQEDWNLLGRDKFDIEVIEPCPVSKLLEREQYWLDTTKAVELGYNIITSSIGGVDRSIFSHLKEKLKEKQPYLFEVRSKNMTEINKRPEVIEKRRQHFIRLGATEEHKEKLRKRNKDPEFIKKMIATRKRNREIRLGLISKEI